MRLNRPVSRTSLQIHLRTAVNERCSGTGSGDIPEHVTDISGHPQAGRGHSRARCGHPRSTLRTSLEQVADISVHIAVEHQQSVAHGMSRETMNGTWLGSAKAHAKPCTRAAATSDFYGWLERYRVLHSVTREELVLMMHNIYTHRTQYDCVVGRANTEMTPGLEPTV
jgi:hypothetical protein